MDEITKIYEAKIEPLLREIEKLCDLYSIPMLTAFCLENNELGDDRFEVTMVGATHLDEAIDPPIMMIAAAAILKIPGFEHRAIATETAVKHGYDH